GRRLLENLDQVVEGGVRAKDEGCAPAVGEVAPFPAPRLEEGDDGKADVALPHSEEPGPSAEAYGAERRNRHLDAAVLGGGERFADARGDDRLAAAEADQRLDRSQRRRVTDQQYPLPHDPRLA